MEENIEKDSSNARKKYLESEYKLLAEQVFEIYIDKYNKDQPLQYATAQPSCNKQIIHNIAKKIEMKEGTAENYSERLFNLWNELNGFFIKNGLENCPILLKKVGSEIFDKNYFLKTSLMNASTFDKVLEENLLKSKKLSREKRSNLLKNSSKKPSTTEVISKQFNRNPYVIDEVLDRANGLCEKCLKPAPFYRSKDNTPYLEVHHIQMLANDGDDTVENAIAVCPNCHRELHFGKI